MQLSTPAMLGCLLSHIRLWESVLPNETIAVFEEDAYIDRVSSERMHSLSYDMRGIASWDVLMLESGQRLISSGEWQYIGDLAATCSSNSTPCTWFGTRGYLITYSGAQHLLRHVYPISVQVDALMGLVAAFSPGFNMYWTRENIAHIRLFHISSVWDACIKCYLPTTPYLYLTILLLCVLRLSYHCVASKRICAVENSA